MKNLNAIHKAIEQELYIYKPAVMNCVFFPNKEDEDNMQSLIYSLRVAQKSIDLAVFTITHNKLYYAIKDAYKQGVSIRIITDDECSKNLGSDVVRLAALGVPVKLDNSVKFHMHHKFAIIDSRLLITGSFNWTTQASENNQENIIFIENEDLCNSFQKEFDYLWKSFTNQIDQDEAREIMGKNNEKF